MTFKKAVTIGLAGNELSKSLTGTSEVSAGRTAIATGSGAILGTLTSSALTLSIGAITVPIALPLAVTGGLAAGIASLFD
jgi:hypothetical protein